MISYTKSGLLRFLQRLKDLMGHKDPVAFVQICITIAYLYN